MNIAPGALTGYAFDLNWVQDKFNNWNGSTFRHDLLPFVAPLMPHIYDEYSDSEYRRVEELFKDEYYIRSVLRDITLGIGDHHHQLQYFQQRHNISTLEDALRYGPAYATLWAAIAPKSDLNGSEVLVKDSRMNTKRTKAGDFVALPKNAGEFYSVKELAIEAPLVPFDLQLGKSDYYRQVELCVWQSQSHNLDTLPTLLFQEQFAELFREMLIHPDVKYYFERWGYTVQNVDCNIAYLKYDKRFEHQYDKSRANSHFFIGLFYVGETNVTQQGIRYPKPVTFL